MAGIRAKSSLGNRGDEGDKSGVGNSQSSSFSLSGVLALSGPGLEDLAPNRPSRHFGDGLCDSGAVSFRLHGGCESGVMLEGGAPLAGLDRLAGDSGKARPSRKIPSML